MSDLYRRPGGYDREKPKTTREKRLARKQGEKGSAQKRADANVKSFLDNPLKAMGGGIKDVVGSITAPMKEKLQNFFDKHRDFEFKKEELEEVEEPKLNKFGIKVEQVNSKRKLFRPLKKKLWRFTTSKALTRAAGREEAAYSHGQIIAVKTGPFSWEILYPEGLSRDIGTLKTKGGLFKVVREELYDEKVKKKANKRFIEEKRSRSDDEEEFSEEDILIMDRLRQSNVIQYGLEFLPQTNEVKNLSDIWIEINDIESRCDMFDENQIIDIIDTCLNACDFLENQIVLIHNNATTTVSDIAPSPELLAKPINFNSRDEIKQDSDASAIDGMTNLQTQNIQYRESEPDYSDEIDFDGRANSNIPNNQGLPKNTSPFAPDHFRSWWGFNEF